MLHAFYYEGGFLEEVAEGRAIGGWFWRRRSWWGVVGFWWRGAFVGGGSAGHDEGRLMVVAVCV